MGRVAPHVAPRLRRLAGEVQRPIRLAIIVIHPLVVPVRGVWLGLGVGVGLGLGLGLGLGWLARACVRRVEVRVRVAGARMRRKGAAPASTRALRNLRQMCVVVYR